jgi:hypothetical protein
MKHGGGSVMIWAAISWYYAGLVITLNLRITASDYMDILGNQLQSYGNRWCFLTMMHFFKMTIRPYTHECSVLVWGAWRCTSTFSLSSTIARLKYHLTTVVSFREQGEQLIPTSITSQATRRCSSWRKVQYSRQMVAPLRINKGMCIFHNCFHYFVHPFCTHFLHNIERVVGRKKKLGQQWMPRAIGSSALISMC